MRGHLGLAHGARPSSGSSASYFPFFFSTRMAWPAQKGKSWQSFQRFGPSDHVELLGSSASCTNLSTTDYFFGSPEFDDDPTQQHCTKRVGGATCLRTRAVGSLGKFGPASWSVYARTGETWPGWHAWMSTPRGVTTSTGSMVFFIGHDTSAFGLLVGE